MQQNGSLFFHELQNCSRLKWLNIVVKIDKPQIFKDNFWKNMVIDHEKNK